MTTAATWLEALILLLAARTGELAGVFLRAREKKREKNGNNVLSRSEQLSYSRVSSLDIDLESL